MKKINLLSLFLSGCLWGILSLGTFSCSHDGGGGQDPDQNLKDLAQKDRDTIPNSVGGFEQLNSNTRESITTFFGGTSGADFQKFLDDRIHFFITQAEYKGLQQSDFGNISTSDTNGSKELKDANVQIAASNIGLRLWLNSVVGGNRDQHFGFRGEDLVLDTPRVGLMLIGPGYNMTLQRKDGSTYVFPAGYRQSILIHEARHSDCPTGLNQSDLDFIKSKSSMNELTQTFTKMTCGNLHSYCPPTHQYKNLPACDRIVWGAYSAGAMFASLAAKSTTDSIDRRIMDIVAADQLSRVLIDTDDMFNGKLGKPELGSLGVVER